MIKRNMTGVEAIAYGAHLLWGEQWQSALSRELRVNLRTCQRIAKAVNEGVDYRIDPRLIGDLEQLLRRRADEMPEAIQAVAETRERLERAQ